MNSYLIVEVETRTHNSVELSLKDLPFMILVSKDEGVLLNAAADRRLEIHNSVNGPLPR